MLETFGRHYVPLEFPLAQAQLVLFMLGMGATLTPRDFLIVGRQPRSLLVGVACVLGLSPLLAVVTARIAGLPDGVAFGLLLVSALPGGTLSNVLSHVARSNVALSIAMSACATLAALVTVPLTLEIAGGRFVPPDFEMPVGRVMREIGLCLLLPLTVGMTLARNAPATGRRVSTLAMRLGFTLVGVMVVGSLAGGRIEPGRYGWGVPIAVVLFTLAGQQLTLIPLRLLGWPVRDVTAMGIEVTIRNVFLGLLLAALLFPANSAAGPVSGTGGDVLFVLLFYGGASVFVALPLTLRIRRLLRRYPDVK